MQELLIGVDELEQITANMYHNTETLLDLYKKVKFRVKRNLADIDEELYIEDRKHLTSLLHEIVDFDASAEKRKI